MPSPPIPTLNSAWRNSPDDRELIRYYAGWPTTIYNMVQLTSVLNRVAITSQGTVTRVQGWIDEIETLEQDWADKVADGTAHLGNVATYEGPPPGTTLSRDDLKRKADVLEWDTSLLKIKYESGGRYGGRSDTSAGGVIAARMDLLKSRIFQALGIKPNDGGSGDAYVVRS